MKKGKGEGRTSSLNINKRGINMKKTLIVFLTAVLAMSMLFVSCSNEAKIDSSPVEISFGASKSRSLSANVSFEDFDNLNWYYKATLVNGEFSQGATGGNFVKLNNGLSTQIAFSQGIWNFELKATKGSGENEADIYTGSRTGVLIQRQQDGSIVTVQIDVMPSSETNGTIVIDPNVNVGGKKVNKVKIGEDNPVDLSPSESNTFSKAAGTYEVILTYEKTVQSDTVDSTVIEYGSETITVTVYGGAVTTISGDISEITQTVVIEPVGKFSTTSTVAITEKNNVTLESTLTPAMDADVNNVAKTTVILPDTIKELNVSEETKVVLTTTVYPVEEAITNENFTVTGSNNTTVAAIDLQLSVGSNSVSTFVDSNNEKVAVTVTTYILKNLSNVVVKYNGIGDQPADISITTSNASEKPNANYYESDTGKLVFTTTHFSEFFVVSDAVCYVKESNYAYNNLNLAAKGAIGKTLVLISDIGADYAQNQESDYYIHLLDNTVFEGNGHTISGFNGKKIIYQMRDSEVNNLVIDYPGSGFFVYKVFTTERGHNSFNNVKAKGQLEVSGNTSLFVIFDWSGKNDENKLIFRNCVSEAKVSGIGGYSDYNALFVGYPLAKNYVFENCINKGSIVCGKAAMFLGNASCPNIELSVSNCVNEGTIISTYVNSSYRMNYYLAMKNSITTLILNDVSYQIKDPTFGNVPGVTDEVTPGVTTTTQSKVYNGPLETGMKLTRTENNTFQITPATNGTISEKQVAKYTVGVGLYVSITNGSNRFFATEDITVNDTTNWETTMRDLRFVDATFVGAGKTEPEGNNTVFNDGNESYYVVGEEESTGGQPRSASIYYLSAFDAEGNLLASVSLSTD